MKSLFSINILLLTLCLLWINPIANAQKNSEKVPESPFIIDLWQDGLPNSNGMEAQGYDDKKKNYKPSIRVYLPKETTTPTKAVIICPGGGYNHLAISHEGYNWGDFFTAQGVAAIVLKYRTPNGNLEVPITDAEEAIRLTKENATKWNIDPNCIGIMGSSAGGHLATTVTAQSPDELRPAFQILFYPVISMKTEFTHGGSRNRFLGENPTEELEKKYSNEFQVKSTTPRTFIALSDDDKVVKPINSIKYYTALQEKGIPSVMHIYPSGNHGWGIKLSFKYHDRMLTDLKSWLSTF